MVYDSNDYNWNDLLDCTITDLFYGNHSRKLVNTITYIECINSILHITAIISVVFGRAVIAQLVRA